MSGSSCVELCALKHRLVVIMVELLERPSRIVWHDWIVKQQIWKISELDSEHKNGIMICPNKEVMKKYSK